jgi:hypothetical protein
MTKSGVRRNKIAKRSLARQKAGGDEMKESKGAIGRKNSALDRLEEIKNDPVFSSLCGYCGI